MINEKNLLLSSNCFNKMQLLNIPTQNPFKTFNNAFYESWRIRNPISPLVVCNIAECVGVGHMFHEFNSSMKFRHLNMKISGPEESALLDKEKIKTQQSKTV